MTHRLPFPNRREDITQQTKIAQRRAFLRRWEISSLEPNANHTVPSLVTITSSTV